MTPYPVVVKQYISVFTKLAASGNKSASAKEAVMAQCPHCKEEAEYDPEKDVWQCLNGEAKCYQMRFTDHDQHIHVLPEDFQKFVRASQS